jgi:hypothetical protein
MPDNNRNKIPGYKKTNKYIEIEVIVFFLTLFFLSRKIKIKKIKIMITKKIIGIVRPHKILKNTSET